MNNELLGKLKNWRDKKARDENRPTFRVLQNSILEAIARFMPKNKEELLAIKGIKERRFEQYGKDILKLVNGEDLITKEEEGDKKKPHTVSSYLDLINNSLRGQKGRIKGEISSLDIRERYLFFSIKDKDDGSLLNCIMWDSDYQISGVSFKEGLEVIIEGFPEIYKPGGRFSFKVFSAELVGEGALKKAYEKLKKKFEEEGLFSLERKKEIPDFVQNIGLITSETGAVIHDFLNNLGKHGYQINFFDSRVEGQAAVKDLISAIDYFENKEMDVLVIIRGGGSLESLQSFNNEVLVRKITDFNTPVICGIGHDKDIPLSSLAADLMVSTPTAVTVNLNKSWQKASDDIRIFEKDIIYKYQKVLDNKKHHLEIMTQELWQRADSVFEKIKDIGRRLMNKITELGYRFNEINKNLKESLKRLKSVDPGRQLKLGYSIASMNGKVIKSVKQINKDDKFDIKVFDGKIKSKVEEIVNK